MLVEAITLPVRAMLNKTDKNCDKIWQIEHSINS